MSVDERRGIETGPSGIEDDDPRSVRRGRGVPDRRLRQVLRRARRQGQRSRGLWRAAVGLGQRQLQLRGQEVEGEGQL